MSQHHVVLRIGRKDRYTPSVDRGSRLVLTLDGEGEEPKTDIRHKHLWSGLHNLGLEPPQAAIDLYRLAVAVYCADFRIPRRDGYDQWTRQIVLHVPVAEPLAWEPQVETIRRLLDYLSGDHWRIELREKTVPFPPKKNQSNGGEREAQDRRTLNAVCLFSGGLDSFIGAADAASDGRNLVLISHVPEGISRWLSPAQDVLKTGLDQALADRRLEHLKITLDPPRSIDKKARENSQRARSFFFLALATTVAASLRDNAALIVPENGFISLNLPLTPGRIGSLSTRTTHPYAMSLYRNLLNGLCLDVRLELPYMLATKGEMLMSAKERDLVHRLAEKSVSCASPNPRSSAREAHCGYCVPCIVRRAAMSLAGLDQPQHYRLDIRRPTSDLTDTKASHLSGFKLAIQNRADGVNFSDLLSAGPLPSSMGTLADFKAVYDRGLAEVAAFLDSTR